jgi:gliding motility-associated-like protein
MMKHCPEKYQKSLLLIFFSLLSAVIFGQGGQYNTTNWRFSNPQPFGITIFDVDFFDNNNVIAVGSDGGIVRSTNSGANWTYGPFTFTTPAGVLTKPSFSDVHFVTANVAYAVGNQGCMVKSTDGGASWSFVNTPLYANGRNINAVWFLNKDTGYIGGQLNTPDSLPKLYFTRNGGTTWDSIAAPAANGKSRVGYINNVNLPSSVVDINSKATEIYRIEFINDSVGYVCGSASSLFPAVPGGSANSTTCLPNGGTLTGSASNAALLWKVTKGVITDYSLSKERLGYTGINTNTVTCTTSYNSAGVTPTGQTYRAMNILNDTAVILMSFNNNCVVRVNTGKNDSTLNVNVAGRYEKGKYIILNFPFPPTGGPNAGPPIPAVQVLNASNPYVIKKAPNGKLFATGNFGRLNTSVDNGVNWVVEGGLPLNKNFSNNGIWALDIAPNGKFLTMGTAGVYADSVPGGVWKTNYVTVPLSAAYNKIEFTDCNNGIATGSANITVTTDGGASWTDKTRADFAASFYSINGFAYPSPSKAYFAVSNGVIYSSSDKGTTLDPVFSNFNFQMQDIAAIGTDTIWAVGSSQFSVPAASRTSNIFRSVNGGVTWSTYSGFPVGTLTLTLTDIEFPTKLIGYAAGNRDTIYKTTDGGVTWNKLPLPFPGITPQITYTDMYALDANTVYLCGNGFPRKVVIKTTDGGNTWTDITSNILTIYPTGNLNGVLFHDANNGYVVGPGGALLITTNGGTSWTLDIAPTANLFTAMAFAPRTVPSTIAMLNRKLFISGPNVSGAPIMEYGNPANINVNSTELVSGSCVNASNGSITINATGGIPPYAYSVNGSAFQTSNTFSGLTAGNNTITVKDAYCGLLTKIITVGVKQNPHVYAGPDVSVLSGDAVTLNGNTNAVSPVIAWSPTATIVTAANTLSPVVKPTATTTYALSITDANGCTSVDNTVVTVIPYCIKVMDAFTPNGDGINDRWLVTGNGGCVTKTIVNVFNRYGGLVYNNNNYQNDWNGTYKGKPVPDGTYYYVINYTLVNGNTVTLKGDVTILR